MRSPSPHQDWQGGHEDRGSSVVSPNSYKPEVASSNFPKQPTPQGDFALGTFLRNYSLKHSSTAQLPRGLTNRSNWCFVNAILQALLACPPLYNLMRSLGTDPSLQASFAKTPASMLSSLVKFMKEFSPLEALNTTKTRNKLVTGPVFEPSCVLKMPARSTTRKSTSGSLT